MALSDHIDTPQSHQVVSDMIAETHETLQHEEPHLAISRGNSNEDVVRDLKELRSEFVKAMGWFPDLRDDTDRYDSDPRTIHLALRDGTEKIEAGMRLTPIDTLEDSLSLEMLRSNPDMLAIARANSGDAELEKRALEGNLWDLTRLVNQVDGSVDFAQLKKDVVELVGAGLAETSQEENDDLTWVFTTTATMKWILDGLGIQSEVLAHGKISAHDKKESFFCVSKPIQALQYVKDNPDKYELTHEYVARGLSKAHAL